tara:strand:- start:3381 stop:4391 length:1011 start_codon:yes stop_codon:yes gene_type:complete
MNDLFGRLMIDINDKSLSKEDIAIIKNDHVGGIILFSRNFESYKQIKNLTSSIFEIKENIIIAVDQEGGRVQRFKNEFTKIPSMQRISEYALQENDVEIFKDIGWLISSELISAGIDINFAPVLDLNNNISTIIGDRSFSNNIDELIQFSSHFIDGMHDAGMQTTGKHFPGHGNVFEDSHKELPIDTRAFEDLYNHDMKPYFLLGHKLDAVMCAHILFPNVDNNIPSFSKVWLKDILLNKLNYKGLILSDDLSMEGAGEADFIIKTQKCFDAGCDMVLICNRRTEVLKVLRFLEKTDISQSSKIFSLKKRKKVDWNELQINNRANKTKEKIKTIWS